MRNRGVPPPNTMDLYEKLKILSYTLEQKTKEKKSRQNKNITIQSKIMSLNIKHKAIRDSIKQSHAIAKDNRAKLNFLVEAYGTA